MLHFPDDNERLTKMTKEEKKAFFKNVDLTKTRFELKIADFGFAAPIEGKDGQGNLNTRIGTLNYMSPE